MTAHSLRYFLLIFAAMPALARAQAKEGIGLGGSLLQMSLGLGLVVIVLFATLYVLKRLAAPRGAASGFLRVITAVAVGPRERVVVVEAGELWLVLGVSPGRVAALTQLPRQPSPVTTTPPTADFAGWLKHMMERKNAR